MLLAACCMRKWLTTQLGFSLGKVDPYPYKIIGDHSNQSTDQLISLHALSKSRELILLWCRSTEAIRRSRWLKLVSKVEGEVFKLEIERSNATCFLVSIKIIWAPIGTKSSRGLSNANELRWKIPLQCARWVRYEHRAWAKGRDSAAYKNYGKGDKTSTTEERIAKLENDGLHGLEVLNWLPEQREGWNDQW